MNDPANRWDEKYRRVLQLPELVPDGLLVQAVRTLPVGRAIDLACGLGVNAVWLARQGWEVTAADVSQVALDRVQQLAAREGVTIRSLRIDLESQASLELEENIFDLALVFRFLDRDFLPKLVQKILRRGGTLVYETFSIDDLDRPRPPSASSSGIKNPLYLLQHGELEALYPDFKINYLKKTDTDAAPTWPKTIGMIAEKRA